MAAQKALKGREEEGRRGQACGSPFPTGHCPILTGC